MDDSTGRSGDRAVAGETVLLVGVGGFVGANARYLVGLILPGLPGTLVVNVTGSLVLGLVVSDALAPDLLTRRSQLLVATGFLSSLTTYSTFALGTATVPPAVGAANVVASYALGFGAAFAGHSAAAHWGGES